MTLTKRSVELVERLDALIAKGDTTAAWDLVDRLIELDEVEGWRYRVQLSRLAGPTLPMTAAALGHLGGALLEAREILEAADTWAEAGEAYDVHDSEHAASMWESAGMAYAAAAEYGLARDAYMRSLNSLKRPHEPTYRDARIGLARVFSTEKNFDESFSAAWWGLRLPQGDVADSAYLGRQAELWLTLGGASVHLHRHSLAEYAFRAVPLLTDEPALVEAAAGTLRMMLETAADRSVPSRPLEPSGRIFHVAWAGAADAMVAQMNAGVFLVPNTSAVLGEAVDDPRR